jgi:hypothetical protein
MYINKKLDIEWWLPPRTASRMTAKIIKKIGFELVNHHHSYNLIDQKKTNIILNVRNPYSIIVSRYKQFYLKNKLIPQKYRWSSFVEFVKFYINMENSRPNAYEYPDLFNTANVKPYYRVRYEKFVNDLMSLDFICNNQYLDTDDLFDLKKGKTMWSENSTLDTSVPYNQYYTEESANMVYNHYEKLFVFDEYEKDSWKTITI